MLAILLDHHIRAEIATALRHRGLDVLTAFDDGSSRIDDEELLARATLLGRVLVSQDRDLLAIAARWQEEGRPFAGLVFAGKQDADVGSTCEWLLLVAEVMLPEEMQNRVEFVPERR
jgi:hypothetical protein